ncbi:AIPR family protein [Methylophilus glucosoxydans]|uniref:AIPR family protein n=1 Tax=Methylophilus glucosoxydans TaxID=752553 RepID=A0ABW3GIJ4_9PROT
MADAWQTTYESRDDLKVFGDNALGLFALGLKFGIEDLVTVGTESITDGSDDKKCDIVYVDKDDGIAVVAQCYFSTKAKQEAPSNKAADLNTAISWLIQRPLNELPERIVSAAQQLRDGITNNEIKEIHIWYIHNLPESNNVLKELKAVEDSAKAAVTHQYPDSRISIHALEVGKAKINEWYDETLSPILVNDEFEIDTKIGFEIDGPEWRAYVTTVEARFLYRQYKKYKTQLFSANVRDYLGSRISDSNINNGIKKTAENEPDNFWVFNNGLTVLVNDFNVMSDNKSKNNKIVIKGMSIVNGAQTTGAIGALNKTPASSVRVPVRFIKTKNPNIVLDIIQFNNSQNKVTASDFRSTDKIQKRIKDEVSKIPSAEYEGGRRGGFGDLIRRRPNLLPSYTVGQSLASFHGDPVIAYNQKQNIWIEDSLYSKYFNENTTGSHIVFAYSLVRAVEQRKVELIEKEKKSPQTLTTDEENQIKFFRKRGSNFLLVSAISSCLETFTNRKISNLFRISFGEKKSPKEAQKLWSDLIDVTIPLCNQLDEALNDGLKNTKLVENVISKFRGLISVTAKSNAAIFKSFSKNIVIK